MSQLLMDDTHSPLWKKDADTPSRKTDTIDVLFATLAIRQVLSQTHDL